MENEIKIGDRVEIKSVQELIDTGRMTVQSAKFIANKQFRVENIIEGPGEKLFILISLNAGDIGGYVHVFCKREDFDIYRESKPVTGSIKNDRKDDKVMMELLPWKELEEIAKVYTAGAKKYGPNKWQNLPDGYQRYKGAMLRHLTEVEKGNDVDPDTGCLHAAQVAWNAIAMLHCKMDEYKSKSK